MRKKDHRVLWTIECGAIAKDTRGYGLPYIYEPKITLKPSKHEPPALVKGTDWIATW
jgi:hypothetical protein